MKKLLIIILMINLQTLSAQGFFNGSDESSTMQDVLKSDCCLLGKYKISGNFGFFYNKITYENTPNETTDYDRYGVSFFINAKFYKEFQLRLNFYADLNQEESKPNWLSNLYYSIGNYNWRNKTFSYGYENYQPNRFDGSYNWIDNMKRGLFFISYNYYLLNESSHFKWDETTQVFLNPFIRYQPEYTDRYGEEVLGNNKIILGMATRYIIIKNIYIEGAVYFYPDTTSKMPWDPDYTYGFGYFDWKSFKLNLSYGNWIANRFSWNEKEMKNDFTNGEIKASFTYIW